MHIYQQTNNILMAKWHSIINDSLIHFIVGIVFATCICNWNRDVGNVL